MTMYGSWSSVRKGAAALIRGWIEFLMMIRLWSSMDDVVKNLMVPNLTEKASRLSSGEMGMPPLPL